MLANAKPLWSALPDGVLRRQVLGDLAALSALPKEDLSELWIGPQGSPQRPSDRVPKRPVGPPRQWRKPLSGAANLLDRALWLLVHRCDLWHELTPVAHDQLAEQAPPYGPAFLWLERHLNDHGAANATTLMRDMQVADFGPQGAALVRRLLEFHDNEDTVDLGAQLTIALDKLELGAVDDELKLMAETGDLSEAALVRARELNRRRADLKHRLVPGASAA